MDVILIITSAPEIIFGYLFILKKWAMGIVRLVEISIILAIIKTVFFTMSFFTNNDNNFTFYKESNERTEMIKLR